MSLRFRLTLFYTLFLAFVLAAVASAVYAFTQRSLLLQLEEQAQKTLEQIQSQGYSDESIESRPKSGYFLIQIHPVSPLSWEDLRSVLPSFRPGAMPGSGNEFDNDNGLLYGSRRRLTANPSIDDLFTRLSDDDLKRLFDTGATASRLRFEDKDLIAYVARDEFKYEGDRSGLYALSLVALPFPTETLNGLKWLLIRTVTIAFIVFAIGVWLLSARVLLPVKRVTQAAAQVSGRDLSQRVPVPNSQDEMKELAVTLNHMLERLQESFETQRRFTADASHELRTPVTAIVGHVNYLLRRTKPSTEQIDSLTVIRREAERMAKLVNDLLELARADAGFKIEREPMNLVEVIEAVHMETAPVAGSSKIMMRSSEPLIEVLGDAARLKQVVLNLVQNALNAGAQHVTIALINEKKQVRLEVLDDGPGIPADAIPHLFDRFYRVDGARSTRGNGSGLGLAIVKWIVQQHNGSVEVESRVGEGTVFTVLLPMLNPKNSEVNVLAHTFAGVRAY